MSVMMMGKLASVGAATVLPPSPSSTCTCTYSTSVLAPPPPPPFRISIGSSNLFKFGSNTNTKFHPQIQIQIRAHSTPPPDNNYLPESKFYKVEAILRPWRIPNVSLALLNMGIRGVTVSDVRGFGAQGGSAERHAGSEFSQDKFVSKVKMEIVVTKDQVESVIDLIIQEARTGEIGDGKIFVMPVSDIIRVRTGERGEQAERMSGGRHDMSKVTSPPLS